MIANKKIAFSDFELEYNIQGEGTPVFFIHGFGETYHVWERQINFLKNNFKLITCNLPGTQCSDFLGEATQSLEGFAQCIKKIVEAENIHSFVLIGHSMGGYVALSYQDLFPKDLIGLGLIHSTCFPDTDTKKENRKKAISFLKNHGSEAFLKQAFPDLFLNKGQGLENIEQLVNNGKITHEKILCSYYEAIMQRPNRVKTIKNLSFPLLFIAGKNDTLIPLIDSLSQSYLAPITFLKILEKSAHMGMLEETEIINETLLKYLTYINQFNK